VLISRKQGLQISGTRWFLLCIVLLPVVIFGGRLLQVFEEYVFNIPARPGNKAYYGGVLLGIAGALLAGIVLRISSLVLLDTLAIGTSLGSVFGRIGCFLNGCCRGGVAPSWLWGVPYPQGYSREFSPTALDLLFQRGWTDYLSHFLHSERYHPAPLYYAAGMLALFLVLWFHQSKVRHRPGVLFCSWLILHGVLRIAVEFVRFNPPYVVGGVVSVAMVLSVVSCAVGGIGLMITRRRSYVGVRPVLEDQGHGTI
jgi:phosphatidylglycerol:prolipoprotein diacylglycerol transferase